MAKEVLLPELAESVVEGEIVKWLVSEGDMIAEDQPIVEVMTDKATVELPSPFAGVLEKRLAQEGDVVPVHHAIALIGESDDATGEPEQSTQASRQEQAQDAPHEDERSIVEGASTVDDDDGDRLSLFRPSADDDAPPSVQVRRARESKANGVPARGAYGRVLAVPAARKLAREKGIDIESVQGSGPGGRVRVEDVERHADSTAGVGAAAAVQRAPYRAPKGYEELEQRSPLRGLRRAISKQMLASHLQSVRTLHVDEADVSSLVALRDRLKPIAEARGVKLSYLPFVMKAVVAALKAFPMLNSSLDEAANEIVTKSYYHLGVAVATDAGLVVPVVKDVDKRGMVEIAFEIDRLADGARAGKLSPDDVQGGTFSITNIGTLGGLFSFPIINVPEAAILGVHRFKKRPVVLEDDTIAARHMVYLSLSFDHRLVDGAEAAMFTSHLIDLLETPESLMLDMN